MGLLTIEWATNLYPRSQATAKTYRTTATFLIVSRSYARNGNCATEVNVSSKQTSDCLHSLNLGNRVPQYQVHSNSMMEICLLLTHKTNKRILF